MTTQTDIRSAMAGQNTPSEPHTEPVSEVKVETGVESTEQSVAEEQTPAANEQPQTDTEPSEDSYEDPAEYRKALRAYEKEQAKKELEAEYAKKSEGLYHDLRKQRQAKRELQAQLAKAVEEQARYRQPIAPEKPDITKFTDPETYANAMVAYDRAVRATEQYTERTKADTQRIDQESEHAEWGYKVQASGINIDAVMQKIVNEGIGQHIVPQAVKAIRSSAVGPHIFEFLGNHPEVADEIEDMAPHLQVAAIKSLETRVIHGSLARQASPTNQRPAQQVQSTPAPRVEKEVPAARPAVAPPTSVRAATSATSGPKPLTSASSMDEFMRLRSKAKADRRW